MTPGADSSFAWTAMPLSRTARARKALRTDASRLNAQDSNVTSLALRKFGHANLLLPISHRVKDRLPTILIIRDPVGRLLRLHTRPWSHTVINARAGLYWRSEASGPPIVKDAVAKVSGSRIGIQYAILAEQLRDL
jgi:hypothetical protein